MSCCVGFLSPSLGLKFSVTQLHGWIAASMERCSRFDSGTGSRQDMPNGLAALSKLPVLGGAQIIAFAGLIETTGVAPQSF